MNASSQAGDLEVMGLTGLPTNDELEVAHYPQQTSPSSNLAEGLWVYISGETDSDHLEYPEVSASPDPIISPEYYWHNPYGNQPDISFFQRFIRYVKRHCHNVIVKVVCKLSTKTRRNSHQTPISTMITIDCRITDVETAAAITVYDNMRLRPLAATSGPTVGEVLDTVLPASVHRAEFTRVDIANALVDSLRLENFMVSDQGCRAINLAPPAPVHVPGQGVRTLTSVAHGNLNEFVATDTCITTIQTTTPTTSIEALNTVRPRWLAGPARQAAQEVFNADPSSMMDAVVDSLTLENQSNRDLRYRVVDLAPLAPVHMLGDHRRVSSEVSYGNVHDDGPEVLEL
ncbi:uncharacterized protein LAJ45_03557 [Morchella importuna]|uniref:uncharacterized protein n=1 Tax=Morchella importuna TaxID=1174673 RepID=UPI001E8EA7CF|nr:uncharacterized protein LAJ45_03557 [Morchella importuna]KAH8152131.1 hypothetical protein LAJ45_03557 [Morchella importuna]